MQVSIFLIKPWRIIDGSQRKEYMLAICAKLCICCPAYINIDHAFPKFCTYTTACSSFPTVWMYDWWEILPTYSSIIVWLIELNPAPLSFGNSITLFCCTKTTHGCWNIRRATNNISGTMYKKVHPGKVFFRIQQQEICLQLPTP